MGVRIIAKDVDAEAFAVEYSPPVRRGLQGIHFLNSSLAKAARNYAPGKNPGSVVGAPVPSSGYLTCTGLSNFIQTDVSESDLMTIFVAARSAGDGSGGSAAAMFTGTFRGTAVDGTAAQGISIYLSALNEVSGQAGFGANQSTRASVTPPSVTSWGLYMLQVKANSVVIRDLTRNLTATALSTPARQRTTNKLRIGSGYTNLVGVCDVGVWQAHSVELTEAEILATAADLRSYMARKGVTV